MRGHHFMKLALALFCLMFTVPALAAGQFWQTKKAEIKKQSRWSLDDWLATKDRNKAADLWLSFNSPSPYEFFFKTAANFTQVSNTNRKLEGAFGIGAYVQSIGLEFDRETLVGPAYHGRIHFRIFGSNVQNTNFTLQAGMRQRINDQTYRQAYAGASAALYLRRFFGLTGEWRSYFGSTPSPYGEVTGSRVQVGPFIDYGALRIFGSFVKETESGTFASYQASASGWMVGAQFFF